MITNTFVSAYKLLADSSANVASLCLRLYLAPIFWMAGTSKFNSFDDTVTWFGDTEWGLGLPFPWLMAFLATATELIGALLLTLGFMTRVISVPLIITMLVAIAGVHWDNGWQAIADINAPFANAQVMATPEKLAQARAILQAHGNYEWLTSSGKFVILNNGIEFATTYLIMLLALIGLGSGKYHSLDFWIMDRLQHKKTPANLLALKQEC